ncbi:MAG TPA: glycosyltransferase 87 family protein [Planctomycetota bacterium]|jgi:hypothetical protein|nr:glycosyltransferase 87 family protein [Planctomycetota bacterium]
MRPERLLAFLLAAYALVSAWDFSARPACIDYYQFWVVGRAVAAKETSDVYAAPERQRLGELYAQRAYAAAPATPTKRLQAASQRRELETYSTPWFYTLFGVFSGADYDASQTVFQRASLLAYAAAIALLARLLGFSLTAGLLAVAALLQWFNPFVDDVIAGNVNRLQLLVVALFLALECGPRFRGRHVVAGVVLGMLLAFKPNLAAIAAVVVLGWGLAGEWRRAGASLAGQVAGVLAGVVASIAFFGSAAPWSAWLRELPRLMAAGSPIAGDAREGNYSLVRLLRDSAGVSFGSVIPALLVLATIAALVVGRRRSAAPDPSRTVLLVGLGAALSLLSTELAWQHYFVAIVPLALFLVRPAGPLLPALLACTGLAMVALQNVGRLFDLHEPAAGAALVAGGTLLLFATGLRELARGASASFPADAGAAPRAAPLPPGGR